MSSGKGRPNKKEEAIAEEPVEEVPVWMDPVVRYTALGAICLMAFAIRLFAVVRWESVIHEFDPYFNYRTTKYLSSEGFYDFLNWFDDRAWYPLGRIIGGTIYPGLMATAASIHAVLNYLNITINVRNMCVFLAPVFAANTAIATYLMTAEVTKKPTSALMAAAMVAIVPSYISRSVGGSYDNEGVAIFALIFTFYTWVKSVDTGSLVWSAICALSYFYMVAAWGGYVFIINIIPIYVVVLILAGRFSKRLYVAYSTFYVLGSLLAMQVPFVGFNIVQQAECAASHGVFVLVQVYALALFLRDLIGGESFRRLVWGLAISVVGGAAVLLIGLQLSGRLGWTGRSLSLLDPTYAKKYIPIIASVSEHQPTAWTSFFFDLHATVPMAPVGLYFLFQDVTDAKIFLILYGTISWYFAGVMVRLMLTLAPAACMLAAVGFSELLTTYMSHLRMSTGIAGSDDDAQQDAIQPDSPADSGSAGTPRKGGGKGGKAARRSAAAGGGGGGGGGADGKRKQGEGTGVGAADALLALVGVRSAPRPRTALPMLLSLPIVLGCIAYLIFYTFHATFVASEAYSSPSIVLASKRGDGSKVIFDDFREAYYWLRQNTHEDARVMSWWDYGYQTSAMANRTVLVDNNTWNNTHIATVGRAMASSEKDAYPIMQSLDVDYVLVIFGGLTGYQSDDINKFLWMVRIGGGVFPHIREPDYFSPRGEYRMDAGGSPIMLDTMMYKMCYYRFDEMRMDMSRPGGFDRARGVEIGRKGFELDHLEEAFTSEHWIVRIYKVKKPDNLVPTLSAPSQQGRRTRQPDTSESDPATRFIGCYASESAFSPDKVYAGGGTGASFRLARHHAASKGKRFFAVARHSSDGHVFAFDSVREMPLQSTGEGCSRQCGDDPTQVCGCADDACSGAPAPGEDNNRRWAVYEMLST